MKVQKNYQQIINYYNFDNKKTTFTKKEYEILRDTQKNGISYVFANTLLDKKLKINLKRNYNIDSTIELIEENYNKSINGYINREDLLQIIAIDLFNNKTIGDIFKSIDNYIYTNNKSIYDQGCKKKIEFINIDNETCKNIPYYQYYEELEQSEIFTNLTDLQVDILKELGKGYTQKRTSENLNLSVRQVEYQIKKIKQTLSKQYNIEY